MFLGNLLVDIIGGILVGLYSDNYKQIFVFAIFWSIVSIINLFTFEKEHFNTFKELRTKTEESLRYKSKIPHKLDWIVIRTIFSYMTALVVSLIVMLIKGIF